MSYIFQPDYIFDIRGCLFFHRDISGAEEWLQRAYKNLPQSEFYLLLREVHLLLRTESARSFASELYSVLVRFDPEGYKLFELRQQEIEQRERAELLQRQGREQHKRNQEAEKRRSLNEEEKSEQSRVVKNVEKERKQKEPDAVQQLVSNFQHLANKTIPKFNSIIRQPEFSDEDIKLVVEWFEAKSIIAGFDIGLIRKILLDEKLRKNPEIVIKDFDQIANASILTKTLRDHYYELGRLFSARSGELCVKKFFSRTGFNVTDISISQINPKSSGEWRKFDLLLDNNILSADTMSIDVKNSRRSEHNPSTYVEYCIPKFKNTRSNKSVYVAGVLSPYLWVSSILDPSQADRAERDTSSIFLGITSEADIHGLQTYFNSPGVLDIDFFDMFKEKTFLPRWIFDYPPTLYRDRDEVLKEIAQIEYPDFCVWQKYSVDPSPILLSAGLNPREKLKIDSIDKWTDSFYETILKWRHKQQLSLPYIYLSILHHFLFNVLNEPNLDMCHSPTDYSKLVFYGVSERDKEHFPLTVYDPLCTISDLINTLGKVWKNKHEYLAEFENFKLQKLNILKGKHRDTGKWVTIFAYCGGCGFDPLIFGEQENCNNCGRLICKNCGLCLQTCHNYTSRYTQKQQQRLNTNNQG